MFRSHPLFAPTRNTPTRGVTIALTALLTFLLAFSPVAVMAAPAVQFGSLTTDDTTDDDTDAVKSVLLGEYVFAELLNGDVYAVETVIAESGSYLITAVDEDAAIDFDLVVTDEAGNELYNDIFTTTDIELEAGTITLTFYAVADNQLGVVVIGQIGGMTDNIDQPGKLVPGSVYINDEVNDTLYATVSIPPSKFPRQVLIDLEPGEGDIYYAYASGEDVYASTTTDSSNLLRFWTHGGDYELEVSAYERRSELTLLVLVTGEPTPLPLDAPVEGIVPAGATEVAYTLELDATYSDIDLAVDGPEGLSVTLLENYYDYDIYYSSYDETSLYIDTLYPGVYYVLVEVYDAAEEDIPFTLSLTGDAGRPLEVLETGLPYDDEFAEGESSVNFAFEIVNPGALVTVSLTGVDADGDFDLTAGLRPGGMNWTSYAFGSEESITFLAPIAGTYYANVLSNDYTGAFIIQVDEGDPAPTLETNVVFYDVVEGYSRNVYVLPIEEAGQLLSVIMVGPEDADLDLTVNGYNNQGDIIVNLSGYSSGSAEAVSYLLPEAGLYEVAVSASYSENGGYFFIQAQLVDPRFFGSQWAVDATASSQFGEEDYSPLQATGPSDTPTAGDQVTAWASLDANGGVETLELTFEVPVKPSGLAIFESFNPGAITTIEAYDGENDAWVAIYEGEAGPTEEAYRTFIPEITPVDFVTTQIRLTLDTSAVEGWNEIDAVQLFGRP